MPSPPSGSYGASKDRGGFPRPLTESDERERLGWPQIAAVTIVAGGIAAALVVWRAGWLSEEWTAGLVLGAVFLTVAALLGRAMLAGSRRDLAETKHVLEAAANDLARAYEELADAHWRLEEASHTRDTALARLRAATRDRESFLATVAHDLKSPLTVIKGHADLLAAHAASGSSPDAGRVTAAASRIAASAQQLTAMVEELLSLARLDIDRAVEQHTEPTDLVALTRRVVDAQAPTAPRHRLRFTSAVPALVGTWDAARLERVLANLLSNAVKYSPGGGEARVTVSAEDNGSIAVLSVADNGVGIPAADLPHVFERFFRAENVDAAIPGTGLGLASVRQIVRAMAGEVAVESREGVGTVVTVRLPLRPPGASSEQG
jgi:signal transduction histidine kinase